MMGLEQGIIDLGSRLIGVREALYWRLKSEKAFLSHGWHMIGAEVW
jgi:hypothetical protein